MKKKRYELKKWVAHLLYGISMICFIEIVLSTQQSDLNCLFYMLTFNTCFTILDRFNRK